MTRRRFLAGGGVAAIFGLPTVAHAAWPGRALRLVVPAPPGGAVDTFARALAEALALALGQAVLVENIPGAGGLVGVKAAARAADGGHTLVLIHSGLLSVQAVNARLDLLREFVPVARLVHSPLALVVRADAPYSTLAELIAAVQARPGQIAYGSGGIGSSSHIAVAEMAARLGHFDVAHIPYNGAAEVATALLRGDIDFQIGVLGAVLPMVRDGRLRALAVTGVSRLVLLPAVPTLAEAALPGFSIEPWGGLAIPVGAAPDAVATLDAALPRVLDASKVQAAMARLGLVAAYADAGSFKRQIAQELDGERQRARRLGITATP